MQVLEDNIDNIFLFAITWSMCCTVDYEGRLKFNALIRDLIKNHTKIEFPEAGLIYNYQYEFSQEERKYVLWEETNKNVMIDPKLQYHEIMIPTSDSARNIFLLKLLISNGKNVLNVGPTGTGKSLNINQLITKVLGD